MTGYGVLIVDDDVLPEEKEFVFVKLDDGGLVVALTRSGVNSPRALADAWAAYRSIAGHKPAPTPRQLLELVNAS